MLPNKRILLAVENDRDGEQLARFVIAHQWPDNAQFMLVHVMSPSLTKDQETETELYGEGLLHWFATRLKAGTFLPVYECLLKGRPVDELLHEISDWKPDLAILGSHGKNVGAQFLFGSVSETVLAKVSCPVIIIRPGKDDVAVNHLSTAMPSLMQGRPAEGNDAAFGRYSRVLIGVENYSQVDIILAQMGNHRWPADVTFDLVHIVDSSELHLHSMYAAQEDREKAEKQAQKLLAFTCDKIKQAVPECTINEAVHVGIPVKQLLDETERFHADLIIVGSHALSRFEQLKVGSVSASLLSKAACAVIIVSAGKQSRNFEALNAL